MIQLSKTFPLPDKVDTWGGPVPPCHRVSSGDASVYYSGHTATTYMYKVQVWGKYVKQKFITQN